MLKLKFEHEITLAYLILGGAWILFSDKLLYTIIPDTDLQSDIQTYKGWLYVVVTAVFFFIFIKRHLIKLRETEQKALESDRLKSAFLTNLSHEIRTPMNGILGFSELLRNPELTEEQLQEYVKIIESSGERILSLFGDLVVMSKVHSGQIGVEKSVVCINEISSELYNYFKPQAEKKGLKLFFVNSLPNDEANIKTDGEKVRAILSHLIKNAIKYTSSGDIEFGYLKKQNNLEFFVSDTGIGIPKEKTEVIFKKFVQAESNLSKLHDGAGLGLSIAKAFVEMLEGKIWVESEEHSGSTFYFTIPYHL
jgi:hypothetical protein